MLADNLLFLRDLKPEQIRRGLRIRPWQERGSKDGDGRRQVLGTSLVTVLGAVDNDGRIHGMFKTIPVDNIDKRPLLSGDGLRAMRGKFERIAVGVEVERQHLFMRAASDDDNAYYVHLHSGFALDNRGLADGHVNRLLIQGVTPQVAGSFSLDGASVKLEDVEGIELSQEQATRMRWNVGKTNPIIGAPGTRHDLWRIPVGAAVLVQTVDGQRYRLAAEHDGLKKVDASSEAYGTVFMDFEMKRRKANREAWERRQAAKAAASAQSE